MKDGGGHAIGQRLQGLANPLEHLIARQICRQGARQLEELLQRLFAVGQFLVGDPQLLALALQFFALRLELFILTDDFLFAIAQLMVSGFQREVLLLQRLPPIVQLTRGQNPCMHQTGNNKEDQGRQSTIDERDPPGLNVRSGGPQEQQDE